MKKDVVIKVESLSKQYQIGKKQAYLTLRDQIVSLPKKLFKKQKTKDFWALKNINFEIKKGEVIGIIGRNGAGKSTLLKILSKIVEPTDGKITMKGKISSLLEIGTGFNGELTGRENIYLNGAILGMSKKEIKEKFDEIIAFSGVENFLDTPVKKYSSGMYVRLAFAVAAHLDTNILLIDEVLAVGDIEFRKKSLGKMKNMAGSGKTTIFVSHDMTSIKQLCSKVIFLKKGEIIDFGKPNKIISLYENEFLKKNKIKKSLKIRNISSDKYHLSKIELRKNSKPSFKYNAGDDMEIHLWTNKNAPANSFSVEYKLYNQNGELISFGASNPVRNTYFKSKDKHFICKLKSLPLTTGNYWFDFSVRVWGMERWDEWKHAIDFQVVECDLYKTGFSIPNQTAGDFVIQQNWTSKK